MNYTWGEIQILSIKKMFLNNAPISVDNLDSMRNDRKYQLYLNGMPETANEGLLRLMSRGKPLVKKHTLTHITPNDIFTYQSYDVNTVANIDLEIYANSAKAYYFEINNDANIEIQQYDESSLTWNTLEIINHISDTAGSYEVYKNNIYSENVGEIRIVFKADDYMYSVRNIAMYSVKFRTEDDVFNNTRKQRYDLRTIIPDFYDVMSVEYEKDGNIGKYNSDFTLEEDNILVIDGKREGNFIITYKAYPTKITTNTSDSFRLNIPSEMAAILPLYIASELYKDDDAAIATQYRNQFEAELDGLKILNEPLEFANNSNWL